jgi:hypothetical protein
MCVVCHCFRHPRLSRDLRKRPATHENRADHTDGLWSSQDDLISCYHIEIADLILEIRGAARPRRTVYAAARHLRRVMGWLPPPFCSAVMARCRVRTGIVHPFSQRADGPQQNRLRRGQPARWS